MTDSDTGHRSVALGLKDALDFYESLQKIITAIGEEIPSLEVALGNSLWTYCHPLGA